MWTRLTPGNPATASEKPPTNAAILARLASNAMAVLNFLVALAGHPYSGENRLRPWLLTEKNAPSG